MSYISDHLWWLEWEKHLCHKKFDSHEIKSNYDSYLEQFCISGEGSSVDKSVAFSEQIIYKWIVTKNLRYTISITIQPLLKE